MSSGTTSAILLKELLSGDGPHGEQADRFVSGHCVRCGGVVRSDGFLTRSGRPSDCTTCRSRQG